MDYRELREVMKFLHCKGLMAKDIYADMLDTLGDSAPSYAMVKKWVTEFRKGRACQEDIVKSGRPRDVSTYENVDYIRHLIKIDERVTVQDIAKYVGISFGSVHAILSKLLELVKVSGRWVPRRVPNDRRMTRLEFCKEIGAWYRVNPNRLVQQTVIDDAWIHHFERTEISSQPPGVDVDNDDPPEPGLLNKALTGELKRPKIGGQASVMGDDSTDKRRQNDNANGVKQGDIPAKIEPKIEGDDVVTSNSGENDNSVEEKITHNEPDSTVQDAKVDSTDADIKVEESDVKNDESSGKSDCGSDNVDSTESLVGKNGKGGSEVSNGSGNSANPNILAILGQRPVNGRPGPVPQLYPVTGSQGMPFGLSGNQLASILAGANMNQLATLAGINPSLLNGANLAQLAGVGNLAQLGALAQASSFRSPQMGQKRPAPELHPVVSKKKLRSGRPATESACVFWDSAGIIHVENLETGQKISGEVYCAMLSRLKEAMDTKRPGALDRGVLLVEDLAPEGAKPPTGLQLLPVPVNSPDLSPSDFHIFPKVKEHLRGRQKTGFVSAITSYLMAQDDSYFKSALIEMERRCTLCVDLNGDYVEK